jgi:hypothetical protein
MPMNALRRVGRWLVLAALVASALFVLPRVAMADPDKEAEDHWNKGVELYKDSDYQASLVEFKRAYEITPNYNFLFNIGQVYWTLKDYVSALKTYQQYLNDGGARIGASRKSDVEKDIESAKGRIATVTVTTSTPGAEVFVDDVSIGTTPLKEPVLVNSGKRKFVASKDGFNPAREVKELAGGDNTTLQLSLVELKPGETAKPIEITPPSSNLPGGKDTTPKAAPKEPSVVGPVVAFVLTGGFAVAWGVTGGLALAADSDLNTLKQTKTDKDALASQADSASTLALVSDVMMVTTIVGAGISIGVTVATFSGGKSDDSKTGKVDVKVGPGSVAVHGTF